MANFNAGYVGSTLASIEGYGLTPHSADRPFIDDLIGEDPPVKVFEEREYTCGAELGNIDKNITYVLSLEGGILNCNQPLLNNTEVKLSFDRALASVGLLYREYGQNVTQPTTMDNGPIQTTDPYLEVEYISSPYLRNFYSQIVDRPITMRYDDCNIYMKTINQGQTMIRVNNIMGGLTPDYLFAGLMKTDALNGNFDLSSTRFIDPGYTEVGITLNGSPVQGYPMTVDDRSVKLYSKYIDTIGKAKKTFAGSSLECRYFTKYYCWISHHFEGEQSQQGWIGLDIKLANATDEDLTLGNFILILIVLIYI